MVSPGHPRASATRDAINGLAPRASPGNDMSRASNARHDPAIAATSASSIATPAESRTKRVQRRSSRNGRSCWTACARAYDWPDARADKRVTSARRVWRDAAKRAVRSALTRVQPSASPSGTTTARLAVWRSGEEIAARTCSICQAPPDARRVRSALRVSGAAPSRLCSSGIGAARPLPCADGAPAPTESRKTSDSDSSLGISAH